MRRLHKDHQGFAAVEGLLMAVILMMIGFVGWYVWHSGQTANRTLTPVTTTVDEQKTSDNTPVVTEKETIAIPAPVNGATTFTGTVTSDGCASSGSSNHPPSGDVGCSLMLGNNDIRIVHGNAAVTEWGSLIGFNSATDITGKKVEVHAVQDGANQFSLSRNDTYVKLLN